MFLFHNLQFANKGLDLSELKEALDCVGIKMAQWEIRKLADDLNKQVNEILVLAESST